MHGRMVALATAAGVLTLAIVGAAARVPAVRGGDTVITVRAGDTLSGIAFLHRTTVAKLVALNGLATPDRIYTGQRLRIAPAAGSSPVAPGKTVPAATTVEYVVRGDENLTVIAARYGTTVDAIVQLNRIANPNRIFAGQRLRIPGQAAGAGAVAQPSATVTHLVAPGENLTVIAARYGTTISTIVALNGLADASYIRAGAVLRIPARSHSATSVTVSLRALPADVARRMALRTGVRDLIVAEARRAGVPTTFALAVAWQESGWQQSVVSGAGAIGVMQLLPATADWVAGSMLHAPVRLTRHPAERPGRA